MSGSTVAFRALQEKMIELGKVAIVRLIMRAGSAPRFAALVAQASPRCFRVATRVVTPRVWPSFAFKFGAAPILTRHIFCVFTTLQKQVVDEYGAVDTPAGMFLIPLPFSDDIRPIASEPTEKGVWVVRAPVGCVCVHVWCRCGSPRIFIS